MSIDMFLKIENPSVDGDSTNSSHQDQIDVQSWRWVMGRDHGGNNGQAASGPFSVHELSVTKRVDRATPVLVHHCAQGTRFESMTLACVRIDSDRRHLNYLLVTLSNVVICSINTGGAWSDDYFAETLNLGFDSFAVSYTPHGAAGTALPDIGPMGWNLRTGSSN